MSWPAGNTYSRSEHRLSNAGVLELKSRNTAHQQGRRRLMWWFIDWEETGDATRMFTHRPSELSCYFPQYSDGIYFKSRFHIRGIICSSFVFVSVPLVCFREQTHGDQQCRAVFYHLLPVSRAVWTENNCDWEITREPCFSTKDIVD